MRPARLCWSSDCEPGYWSSTSTYRPQPAGALLQLIDGMPRAAFPARDSRGEGEQCFNLSARDELVGTEPALRPLLARVQQLLSLVRMSGVIGHETPSSPFGHHRSDPPALGAPVWKIAYAPTAWPAKLLTCAFPGSSLLFPVTPRSSLPNRTRERHGGYEVPEGREPMGTVVGVVVPSCVTDFFAAAFLA